MTRGHTPSSLSQIPIRDMGALYSLHSRGIIGFFAEAKNQFRVLTSLQAVQLQVAASFSGKKPKQRMAEFRARFPEIADLYGML